MKLKQLQACILMLVISGIVSSVNAQNTAYGSGALVSITTGTGNAAFGSSALRLNTTGSDNTALGEGALSLNISGGSNVGIGTLALYNTTSGGNVGIGWYSMIQNTTGFNNVALGASTLYLNTTGSRNTAIGEGSGFGNSTGWNNIALGYQAGLGMTTGSYNTRIGVDPLLGTGIVTGDNNTIIGSRISGLSSNLSNTIVLADGSGNQRLYIDNNGNAGLGTTTPTTRLEINSNVTDASGLKFTQLTSSSATVAPNGTALTVDATGNVVLTTAGGGGNSYFTNATVGTGNIINTNTGGVIIGTGITSAPAGYKLYVSDGILTEKVKVAIKNSANWADYVFEEKYKLLDLAKLEEFIIKNKHLPGIQSANEIMENGGVELGQITVKLLEKIEELTLYIIQLKKENDKIQLKLDELSHK